jgi:hypothetical protein
MFEKTMYNNKEISTGVSNVSIAIIKEMYLTAKLLAIIKEMYLTTKLLVARRLSKLMPFSVNLRPLLRTFGSIGCCLLIFLLTSIIIY